MQTIGDVVTAIRLDMDRQLGEALAVIQDAMREGRESATFKITLSPNLVSTDHLHSITANQLLDMGFTVIYAAPNYVVSGWNKVTD